MPRSKRDSSDSHHHKRVTLQDIAAAAGLHPMTVSNALNDARIVAPKTRERVKQIARELHYVPNPVAKALVTGRTGIIAVMSGPLNQPYYGAMVHSLETHLNAEGYRLLLTPYEITDLLDAIRNKAVDGAIAIDRHTLIEQYRIDSPLPCVAISTVEHAQIDSVLIDLSAGIAQALRKMKAAGCRRIAYFVTNISMAMPSETRGRAYYECMKEFEQEPEIINVNTDELDDMSAVLRALFQKNGCPDALFCQNDETAMCAYQVVRELGLRVPEDVMIVGCDGQLHMKYFDTPLSTVAQPLDEVSATAWKFLKSRMADPTLPLQHAVLPGELIVRASLQK